MKKFTMVLILILFISNFSLNESITISDNNILYVGGNGPNNYTKIQDAINAAKDGYIIYVYPGYYNESIIINKSVSLIGIGDEKPVIDGKGNRSAVKIIADGCLLKNFEIVNHGNFSSWPPEKWGMGIEVQSENNIIEENIVFCNWDGIDIFSPYNIVVNNTISKAVSGGITCWGDNNTIIYNNVSYNPYAIGIQLSSSNNTVLWNVITHNFHGIFFAGNNNNISYNIICNNRECGIQFSFSSYNKILHNILCNNKQEGIVMADAAYNTIAYNNISSNGWGGIIIKGGSSSPLITYGNKIYRNNICYNNGKGIYFMGSGSNNLILENNLIENECNARFSFYRHSYEGHPYRNTWLRNYWSDWRFPLPKPILGRIWEPIPHYWLNFDWNPALEPWEI